MHIFPETTYRKKIYILHDLPSHIKYNYGTPAIAHFSNGDSCSLGCLGCANPKCMYFDIHDIICSEINDFPSDQILNVCPVKALSWNAEFDFPVVDTKKCINCGICINRCPIGAIYFDNTIKINYIPSNKTIKSIADSTAIALQAKQISLLSNIKKSGIAIMESNKLFQSIYKNLSDITSNYHNIIVRNLLISLGCTSAMRRKGDVYTRMDAIYLSADQCIGAIEVEFGKDTLEALRGILDDIAVLYTRYSIKKEKNTPLVVCLQLPNIRQGYWQVIKDIKAVQNIAINTITIGAMMLLNWNRCLFTPSNMTYYFDYDDIDLRSIISRQIQREIHINEKYLGIFEPIK